MTQNGYGASSATRLNNVASFSIGSLTTSVYLVFFFLLSPSLLPIAMANGALHSNPTVATIDITTRASNWLWAVFAGNWIIHSDGEMADSSIRSNAFE